MANYYVMTGVMRQLIQDQGFDLALAWTPAMQEAIGEARKQTIKQALLLAADAARPGSGHDVVLEFVEALLRDVTAARRKKRAATRQAKFRTNGFAAVEAPAAAQF